MGETRQSLHCKINGPHHNIWHQRPDKSPEAEHFNSNTHSQVDMAVMVMDQLQSHDPCLWKHPKPLDQNSEDLIILGNEPQSDSLWSRLDHLWTSMPFSQSWMTLWYVTINILSVCYYGQYINVVPCIVLYRTHGWQRPTSRSIMTSITSVYVHENSLYLVWVWIWICLKFQFELKTVTTSNGRIHSQVATCNSFILLCLHYKFIKNTWLL